MTTNENPATCGNCPHSRKMPDNKTLVCELNPPIPLLQTKITNIGGYHEELNYTWNQPIVRPHNGCAQHPERMAAAARQQEES